METSSTIPQNPIYTKDVSSRDTFHNFTNFNLYYYVSLKFDFILKVSLQKTPSTILKKLDLYWMCLLKRHLSQFHKIQYILKETLFTISQILIYIESVSSRDIFYNSQKLGFILKVSFQDILSTISQILIYTTTCLLNLILYWRCLFKGHLLQFPKNWIYIEDVSSRDIFHNSTKTQYILKRDTFHNFTNFNLYWFYIEGVSWRNTFHN